MCPVPSFQALCPQFEWPWPLDASVHLMGGGQAPFGLVFPELHPESLPDKALLGCVSLSEATALHRQLPSWFGRDGDARPSSPWAEAQVLAV